MFGCGVVGRLFSCVVLLICMFGCGVVGRLFSCVALFDLFVWVWWCLTFIVLCCVFDLFVWVWCSVSYTFLILGVFYHGTRFISILKYIVLSGVRGDRRSVTFC